MLSAGVVSVTFGKAVFEIRKTAYPTFKTENLNNDEREKLEKFEATFSSLAKDLKYNNKTQEKIERDLEPAENLLWKKRYSARCDQLCEAGMPFWEASDKALGEYWDSYHEMIGNEVEKRGKGVCRGFADLLVCKGREIGLEIFRLDSDDHAANIYKVDGKWYVVDLTMQITSPWLFKDKKYFYRMPLEYYISYGLMKNHEDSMEVWVNGTAIPLGEFLRTH